MLTLRHIQEATEGCFVQGDKAGCVNGVSIDSRQIKKGNLFIAIRGQRLDGHKFLDEVIKKGAKAVIVSKGVALPQHIAVIRVKDTTRALGCVANYHRRQFNIPVIAVTGSAGKTTTKEMIAAVLATRYKVLKNLKTENNQYGVPLTLLKLTPAHQVAVLELGTNQPG